MAVTPTVDGRDGSNGGALEVRRECEMAGHHRGGRGPRPPPAGWARSRSKTRHVDHAEGVQPVQRRARALQGALGRSRSCSAAHYVDCDEQPGAGAATAPTASALCVQSSGRSCPWGPTSTAATSQTVPRRAPRRTAAALRCARYRRPSTRPAPRRPRPRGCSRSRLRSARPPHRRLLTRRTTRYLAPCAPSRRLGSRVDDDGRACARAAGAASG